MIIYFMAAFPNRYLTNTTVSCSFCVVAQPQDQDDGMRPRTEGEDTLADFLAGGDLGLLGVEEPWSVNNPFHFWDAF